MVKELIHDPFLLARKSAPATKADLPVARDLLDTLLAHRESCVGMAANMIGVCVRIIVFDNEGTPMTMLYPELNLSARQHLNLRAPSGSLSSQRAPSLPHLPQQESFQES